ncbi:esterase family protein [Microbacterium sp. RU33B]|uniref:alpha/beta hydrolase n=1 Tax=Microbacterium sp. RU33B TaxID=1907390 RepID=UPI000969A2BD|nr:alpha/beta hydrolase-fold protein [Microbacterium sp. RU33B]SIT69260.1 Enterochelin esterase [Microbacterium sp. RU33B]
MNALLDLQIIDSPAMWIVYAVAIALIVVVLARRPTPRGVVRTLVCVVVGAVVGIVVFLIANATNAMGVTLPPEVAVWASAALAGVGLAVASLWDSPPWRKVVAIVLIVWMPLSAVVGINAFYGLNPTLGSLFGAAASRPLDLPPAGAGAGAPAQPLYETWRPPADMPAKGERGTQAIEGTVSGFVARDAGIYLPPAALVDDAPPLPMVIMMMGYVGNPDPTIISDVLDEFAAAHDGLAPIVIVADQLGGDGNDDPACADSTTFGNAETYVTTDVVNWARTNLNVIDDPRYWVVAGYSNGGGCAIKYGVKYPQTFGNIIDVSGEEYPGSESVTSVIADVYGGDRAAFEASKPIRIMQGEPAGTYAETTAIFTVGSEDPDFLAAARAVSAAAEAAGMATTLFVVDGADHGGTAVSGGLAEGFAVLSPMLGFSAE